SARDRPVAGRAAPRRLPPSLSHAETQPAGWTEDMSHGHVPDMFKDVQVPGTRFFPVLISRDDEESLGRAEPVLDKFFEDLVVAYTSGPPYGERLVSWGDLDRFGLSRRGLRHHAADNLDGMLDQVRIHGQPPALMLSFDGLESSVLLSSEFWDGLEQ